MKTTVLTVPEFGFIIATRAALGAGIGLLLSERLSAERRRRIGTALVTVGAITTVPALLSVRRGFRRRGNEHAGSKVNRDDRLIGATRFPRRGDDDVF